ncbi:MAG: hypothetical protein ABL858_06665 [Candidatus Nitrotoga sp.]
MLSRLVNQFLRSPTSLDDQALEYEWVDVKGKLLRTSAYESKLAYSSLYDRCDMFLRTVTRRHRHFILDAEAISPFYSYMRTYADCLRQIDHGKCENIASGVLPGLILAAYTGGETRTTAGENLANPSFVIRGLDFIINTQKNPIGLFLKGLVLKYGISLAFAPNIYAAEKYLQAAHSLGVGSATIELEYLFIHRHALTKIVSIHTDHNELDKWVIDANSALPAELTVFGL